MFFVCWGIALFGNKFLIIQKKKKTSYVQRMFGAELEQFHERVEQSFEHPRNPPTAGRRERLPRRGARVDEEEYNIGDFEDENGYDSGVINRRYGGRRVGF